MKSQKIKEKRSKRKMERRKEMKIIVKRIQLKTEKKSGRWERKMKSNIRKKF